MGPLRATAGRPQNWTIKQSTLPRSLIPILGAGFSRSISPDYPLFRHFRDRIAHKIGVPKEGEDDPRAWRRQIDKANIIDLLEWIETHQDRVDVVKAVLAWPLGDPKAQSIEELADSPFWQRAWHPWKTNEEFLAWIDECAPYHLDVLHPCSPAVIVARLLRERVFSRVVTTNWDTLLELGAALTGIVPLGSDDHHPPRLPLGDRELLRVVESSDDYLRADQGHALLQIHKINGGVRTILRLLQDLAKDSKEDPTERRRKANERLRKVFMITTSDLHEWETNQWARSLFEDALRSTAVLLVGVSAEDAVTYRLLRARRAEQDLVDPKNGVAAQPTMFAWSHSGRNLRLESALPQTGSPLTLTMAQCKNQWGAWELVYSWALLRSLIARIEPPRSASRWLIETLNAMGHAIVEGLQDPIAKGEALRTHELGPWLDLLAAAVPRWMTLSLMAERPPALVAEGWVNASLPTFYLPFMDQGGETYVGTRDRSRTRSLQALASLLAALWEARDRLLLEVDAWTGMVTIAPRKPPHFFPEESTTGKADPLLKHILKRVGGRLALVDPQEEDLAGPLSFVALFPPRTLHTWEIKAATRLLGDRRSRFRGGLAGGRSFICVVQPEDSDSPGEAEDVVEHSKFLGSYLPLITLSFGELRGDALQAGRRRP